MVYLVGGGFWVVFGQMVGSALALARSVAFARLLSSTDFGLYKYVLSLAGIVSTASLTGMATAVTQAVSKGSDGSLRVGFAESMRWSGSMLLIPLSMGVYYFAHGNVFLGLSLCIARAKIT